MISDVLFESIPEIEEYIQSGWYGEYHEIEALLTLMRSILLDLDTPPGDERILTLKTFFKEIKAIGIFILYMCKKIGRNIFRKKNIKYFRLKEE
ncbi:MAG: hypothetical protein P4L27_12635 [Ignavibacteriaceae bacterium]|nr:hypothetical protein [Ignavibacteriaceae bacterium]